MRTLFGQAAAALSRLGERESAWLAALDRTARGWRGPALAALVVLVGALPGLLAMPPLDRDEARFAQATAQMLETGDFVNIRLQDQPRDKKPVGIHWLQAFSVQVLSSVEKREIWPYRVPSILGAMLAAAACAWGARAFVGARAGAMAGILLGATMLLSTEGFIAKTDAVLCGATVLSMAALGRLYLAAQGGPAATPRTRLWFWLGMALAVLVKGPVGPMVAGLAMIALWIADRRADWIGRLGWVWGPLLVVAVAGPWAVAITVATDGRFWTSAIAGDLAPKLAGGQESHWGPPGLHLVLSPLLFFPAALMLPAALAYGWRHRREPFARFALAWLLPGWLVFELAPTKLVHYPLPLYAALAWLAAGALKEPFGPWSRRLGAALSVASGALLGAVCLWAAATYGSATAAGWSLAAAILLTGAGVAGALALLRRGPGTALTVALALGVLGHGVLAGGLAPALRDLWVSDRAAQALADAGLDPRNGVTPGPPAAAGYAEPSLVFALGTSTELGGGAAAAAALAEGRPARVEAREEPAFRAALAVGGIRAQKAGVVEGYDYSDGDPVALGLWRALTSPSGRVSGPARP
jgi:4-amino-4-deoxy-L-arabinose transferase-like glycosyltransferase